MAANLLVLDLSKVRKKKHGAMSINAKASFIADEPKSINRRPNTDRNMTVINNLLLNSACLLAIPGVTESVSP